jgi:hypothetical protein
VLRQSRWPALRQIKRFRPRQLVRAIGNVVGERRKLPPIGEHMVAACVVAVAVDNA